MNTLTDPRFTGLVHVLTATVETALGGGDVGPLRIASNHQAMQGLRAAKRSLDLLELLKEKTKGNLTEQERAILWDALNRVRGLMDQAEEALEQPADAVELPTG